MTDAWTEEGGSADRGVAGLLVALVLGAAARIGFLSAQSYSMDEVFELELARNSPGEIVHFVDGFPPLYHLVLHGWLEIFGTDAAARWLSVAFGILAILCVWQVARLLVGPRGANWAAVILAVLPFHIWYSQEVRAYSFFIFLAALSLWLFFRARSTNRWTDWALFVGAATAGMYAHYFFIFVPATLALCLLLDGRAGRQWWRGWAGLAALAVLCVPELFLLRNDFVLQTNIQHTKPSFSVAALGYTYFSIVGGFTLGPSVRELHTMNAAQALRAILPWLPILGLAVGYPAWSFVRSPDKRAALRPLLILCLAPVVLVGLFTNLGELGYNVRYASWVVIPVVVWLGAGVACSIGRWEGKATLVLLVAILALARWNRVTVDRYREEDSRALAAFLKRDGLTSRQVLVTERIMALPVGYYLGSGWTVETVPHVSVAGDSLDAAVSTIVSGEHTQPDRWFVYSRPFVGDPGGLLLDRLQSVASHTASFAGIDLYTIDRGGAAETPR